MEEISIGKQRKIDRFDKYLFSRGLNDNKVTTELGLSVGTLSKSRKENRDLSGRNIELILKYYTDLSRVWLLTGEGEMLKKDAEPAGFQDIIGVAAAYTVPLLPISAQGGALNDYVISTSAQQCERIVSPVKGADWAMHISGDSMAPEYPSGCIVLLKRVDAALFIEWGKVYVLDTANGSVIKELRPSAKDNFVKCVSINPDQDKYAPFEVDLHETYGVYRVIMTIATK